MNTCRRMAALLLGLFLVACGPWTATSEQSYDGATIDVATAVPQGTETITAEPAFTPVFETAACQFQIPDGREVRCGYLTLPEDHNHANNGRTIRIHVAIFASENENPPPDPMIYLAGGPGADALESVPYNFEVAFAPYLVERDLILFDQRGTGYSDPSLACPEYTEMVKTHIGENVQPEEIAATAFDTILACRDRLVTEDVNLAVYNSTQSAADVEMLRQALGYDQWNLYGASYGSRLAQTILRDYPDGVRSVILDSTYPLAANLQTETPSNVMRAMDLFFTACAADAACQEAYPELETVFWNLVNELNEAPITIEVPDLFTGKVYEASVNGNTILSQLFQSLYNPDLTALFPQLIDQLAAGNTDMLSGFMAASLAKLNFVSLGMMFSVQCHEEMVFSDPDEIATAVAVYPELEDLFASSITSGVLGLPVCDEWGAGQGEARENEPVISDIPTLILQGEFDPITPPTWGELVANGLSNHYFYEFPGQGHGPGLTHDCPRSVALAFLHDPLTEPDGRCRAEMKMSFVTPVNTAVISFIPVTNEESGLQANMPDGWLEVAPEYRVSPDRTIELVVKEKRDADLQSVLTTLSAGDILLELKANEMVWEVREIAIEGSDAVGYIATTPSPQGFYMVLMLTKPEQQVELLDALVIPVIESVVPLNE